MIVVTGGAGYIGSHTAVELLNKGYNIAIIDDFSNSKPEVLENIKKITNKDFIFYEIDINDQDKLEKAIEEISKVEHIDCVIHFAGYKAVGESVLNPLKYYENNICGTITLLEVMKKNDVKSIIFSSSATVYGDAKIMPIDETYPLSVINPYGRTKLMIEDILRDLYISDKEWNIGILRYFNPVGAHSSGLIGEDPEGIPNNLMPYVLRVAAGQYEKLTIFGNDYDTEDGTCIRDYIHVVDLAEGHLAMLNKMLNQKGLYTYNLGTGRGTSVLEIVNAFEKANNVKVNYVIGKRREGDSPVCYTNIEKAKKELGFIAKRTVIDMCKSMWNFYLKTKEKEEETGKKENK